MALFFAYVRFCGGYDHWGAIPLDDFFDSWCQAYPVHILQTFRGIAGHMMAEHQDAMNRRERREAAERADKAKRDRAGNPKTRSRRRRR